MLCYLLFVYACEYVYLYVCVWGFVQWMCQEIQKWVQQTIDQMVIWHSRLFGAGGRLAVLATKEGNLAWNLN